MIERSLEDRGHPLVFSGGRLDGMSTRQLPRYWPWRIPIELLIRAGRMLLAGKTLADTASTVGIGVTSAWRIASMLNIHNPMTRRPKKRCACGLYIAYCVPCKNKRRNASRRKLNAQRARERRRLSEG